MGQKVAILGASQKPERYAYKAFKMLQDYGHQVFPVSPKMAEIEGKKVVPHLSDLKEKIDTLTMYVGPEISSKLENEIIALKPKRIIFNPGSENPDIEENLEAAGIEVVPACTLVMLRSNQFDM